jgi:hypothetical protein
VSQLTAIHAAGRNPAHWQPVIKQYICNVPAGEVQCMDPRMVGIVLDFLRDVICKPVSCRCDFPEGVHSERVAQ